MKEQFHSRLEDLNSKRNLKIIGIVIIVTLASIVVLSSDSDTKKTDTVSDIEKTDEISDIKKADRMQFAVGEDAWRNMKEVNITDQLEPSSVNLAGSDALIWKNRNEFEVIVDIKNVERSFRISPEGSRSLNPSSGFEYKVGSDEELIGAGRITVE